MQCNSKALPLHACATVAITRHNMMKQDVLYMRLI